MLRFLFLGCVFFVSCGDPTLGGPCKVTCDCANIAAPSKCTGEWVCNASSTCQYTCKTACSGAVSTCGADDTCNGSLCSSRQGCQ